MFAAGCRLRPLRVRRATRGRVRVSVRSADRRLGRLRGVRFSIPARQSSRIRLGGRAFASTVVAPQRARTQGCPARERVADRVAGDAAPARDDPAPRVAAVAAKATARGRRPGGEHVRGSAVRSAAGAHRTACRPLGRDAQPGGPGVADRGATRRRGPPGRFRSRTRRPLPGLPVPAPEPCVPTAPAFGRSVAGSRGCARSRPGTSPTTPASQP